MSLLPWITIGVLVIEFSLSDDLPAPRVRRATVVAGLLLLAAVSFTRTIGGTRWWNDTLAAAGPLAYLLIHQVLRATFRKWKGEEPNLVASGTGQASRRRFFYQKDSTRRVTWLDYLYTFCLGMGMLLAAAPAIRRIIDPPA